MSKLTIFQRKYLMNRIKVEGIKQGCAVEFINILCDKIALIDTLTHEQFEYIINSISDYVVHNPIEE